ncbi:hypothetical protein D3C80_1665800 [compost metagenome]
MNTAADSLLATFPATTERIGQPPVGETPGGPDTSTNRAQTDQPGSLFTITSGRFQQPGTQLLHLQVRVTQHGFLAFVQALQYHLEQRPVPNGQFLATLFGQGIALLMPDDYARRFCCLSLARKQQAPVAATFTQFDT